MKSRSTSFLPWLCIVGLSVGLYFFYSDSQKKARELNRLQGETAEVDELRAELQNLRSSSVSPEELDRLRKENREIYKLRNEIAQLRRQMQQTPSVRPVQSASFDPDDEDGEAEEPADIDRLRAENEQLKMELEEARLLAGRDHSLACVDNMQQIDGAKEQWALEQRKSAGTPISLNDILPYMKDGVFPVCPSGGAYSLNPVGQEPTCSVPEHSLLP